MNYKKQLLNSSITVEQLGKVYEELGGRADWRKLVPLRLAEYCDQLKEQQLDNLKGMSGDYHDWKTLQAETYACEFDFAI